MTATAERSEALATEFEKETVDVLELLTLRVNELSEQNAALLERVNTQSALVQELNEAQLSGQLESAQYELYLQDCQISELKQSIEDLMAGGVATKTGHTIRARVAHDFTKQDGHRLKETTVEFTSGSDGAIDWERIDAEMTNAYVCGLIQANYRNSTPNPATAESSESS